MAIAIPRVITNDSAITSSPGGGSLLFSEQFQYLYKTFAAAGNRRRWTCSYWAKVTDIDVVEKHILGAWIDTNNRDNLYYGNNANYHYNMKLSGSWHVDCDTDAAYRDPGWYHFCHVWDTNQSSSGDRVNTYVNGVNQSFAGSSLAPAQAANSILMAACAHQIGAGPENDGSLQASNYYEGYLSQFYWVDGQALAPTDFAYRDNLTNSWRPKFYDIPTSPNNGTTWSSNGSVSGNSGSATKTFDLLFNGNLTEYAEQSGDDVTLTWTPSPAIRVNKTMRINFLVGGSPADTVINSDTTAINVDPATGWVDVPVPHGGMNFSKFEMPRGGSGVYARASAIEIDGYILLDGAGNNSYYLPFDGRSPVGEDKSGCGNNWDIKKLLNQTTYDKATSGFPILNTVHAGGVGTSGVEGDYTLSTPKAVKERGCVRFDGSGSYLSTMASSSDFTISGDFTVECWVYPTDGTTGANDGIWQFSTTAGGIAATTSGLSMEWEYTSSSGNRFNVMAGTDSWENSSTNRASNKWYHIAMVRSSGTIKTYVNGVEDISFSNSDTFSMTYAVVGAYYSTSNIFNGFISNFRFVNGTAVYTSGFTVNDFSEPLKNITNTKLLCCQSFTTSTEASVSPSTYTIGWSGYITGGLIPGSADQYVPSNCFDGDVTTTHVRHTSTVGERGYAGWFFQPPEPISYSSLEIHTGVSGVGTQDYILNGGTATGFAENSWVQIDGSAGTLTSLQITPGSTGNANIYLGGIRINGSTILTDPLYNHGTATARSIPSRSEASGSLQCALPLNANNFDASNQINIGSKIKTVTITGAAPKTDYGHFYGASYYFDGTDDEIVVSDSTAFDVGYGDFTAECWWNRATWTATRRIFSSGNSTSSSHKSHFQLCILASGIVRFDYDATAGHTLSSPSDIINSDTWFHTAIQRNSSSGTPTMEIYFNGVLTASTTSNASFDMNNTEGVTLGRESTGSGWFKGWIQDFRFYNGVAKYNKNFIPPGGPGGGSGDSAAGKGTNYGVLKDSPYGVSYSSLLQPPRDNGSLQLDGTGDYLEFADNTDFAMSTGDFTVECWVYANAYGGAYNAVVDCRDATTQATGWILGVSGSAGQGGAGNVYIYNDGFLLESTLGGVPLYKWTHLAYVRSSGTHALYVDGVIRDTSTSSYTYSVDSCQIGASYSNAENWTGWISNVRIVKGSAVYITDFTPPTEPLTNITNTKLLCCQGNEANATEYVVSPGAITPNGNISSSKFNPFDGGQSNTDIVLGEPANYCTWNMLVCGSAGSGTYYGGNLRWYSSGTWKSTIGTMAVSSGRWYYEQEVVGSVYGTASGNTAMGFGWAKADQPLTDEGIASGSTQPPRITSFWNTGGYNNFGAYQGTVCTPATGDVMATALDKDNNTVKYYLNGIEVLSFTLGDTTSELIPYVMGYYAASYFETNFGQRPFKFAPPEGYRPLNSSNIALQPGVSSRIVNPTKYFDVVLYQGTGASHGVSGYNFAPDFVWVKRTDGANGQNLFDVLRGPGNYIQSSSANQQGTDAAELESFDPTGFTYGGNAGGNASGGNYVSWCWKAGGKKGTFNIDDVAYDTAALAKMDVGDLTVTGCSVGTRNKFSIVKYTGNGSNDQTVAHGLGAIPAFVMVKDLDNTMDWCVKHKDLTSKDILYLNSDSAEDPGTGSNNGIIDDLSSTTTINFTNGGSGNMNMTNKSSTDYIMYAWANVPGLQKFGIYTGDHNSYPFVYLGFKPALVVIKRIDSSNNWNVQDYRRTTYNGEATTSLQWDNNNSEATIGSGYQRDQLSNGFRIRNSGTETNGSGGSYVYMAWAKEAVGSVYGGQSTARGEV